MPDRKKSTPSSPFFFVSPPGTPPPPVDLSEITEATRRLLYDIAVRIHFTPTLEEVRATRKTDEWVQQYGPDECRLTVVHLLGSYAESWIMPSGLEAFSAKH